MDRVLEVRLKGAATACLAARAGIRVVATGGLGGVHRGGERSLDISADVVELGRTRVAVVCSGAKAILDLPRTLEVLETAGVPIVGYGTDELPAFWSRDSGLRLAHRVEAPEAAARVMEAQWRLELGALVFAVPPPSGAALPPFLLDRLAAESRGRTIEANLALLEENARVAARIAAAYAGQATREE